MTVGENARFTAYRLVSEWIENTLDNIRFGKSRFDDSKLSSTGIAHIIKTAYRIGAISEMEVKMLGYNLDRLTFDEIMNAAP